MSMKRTDIEKNLAKKIDGRMKSGAVPQRFGQGAAQALSQMAAQPRIAAPKLVPIACRLPAALVNRIRGHAMTIEGGMNAVITQAVELWLDSKSATAGSDAN
jgi:hypothetical protein